MFALFFSTQSTTLRSPGVYDLPGLVSRTRWPDPTARGGSSSPRYTSDPVDWESCCPPFGLAKSPLTVTGFRASPVVEILEFCTEGDRLEDWSPVGVEVV